MERIAGRGEGELRAVVNAAYGLTTGTTVVAGAAFYPTPIGDDRQLVTAGVRTSLFGLAAHADAALDSKGGIAAGFGLAGQVGGVSGVLSHAEYRGGFVDENLLVGDIGRRIERHSELTADFALPSFGGTSIPLTLRALRDGFADGGSSWIGSSRASTTILNTLLSAGFDYQRQTVKLGTGAYRKDEQLGGIVSVSRFVDFKWQLRAVLDYELLPSRDLRALSFTADRAISDRIALRFGLGRLFQAPNSTNAQLGATFRLPFGDIALSGDYSAPRNDWSIGLRFAFGLGWDRNARRYRVTPPGPASGGSAVFTSFIDANANGRFDKGEAPVPAVAIEGGERKQVTGETGRAFLTGLGTAPTGRLQVGTEQVENLYVTTPPRVIEFSPRPGKVLSIDYPFTPSGEILAHIRLHRAGQNPIGLSAVRVRLTKSGAEVRSAVTEYDGSVVFNDVPAGEYVLELDPAQADQLGMHMVAPVAITVGTGGGASADVEAEVEFENAPGVGKDK